jgi:hypothetical protein
MKKSTRAAQATSDLPPAKRLLADRSGSGHTAHQGEPAGPGREVITDSAAGVFQVEREGSILIVTPLMDLRELDYPKIEAGARDQGLVDLLVLSKDAAFEIGRNRPSATLPA